MNNSGFWSSPLQSPIHLGFTRLLLLLSQTKVFIYFYLFTVKLALETNQTCLGFFFLLVFWISPYARRHVLCISILSLPCPLCYSSSCLNREQEGFLSRTGQMCYSSGLRDIYISDPSVSFIAKWPLSQSPLRFKDMLWRIAHSLLWFPSKF